MARPDKIGLGKSEATNYWGYGPKSGYRIRVTVASDGSVITVSWADRRKQE